GAGLLVALQLKLEFVDQIKEAQTRDLLLLQMLGRIRLVNGKRVCVPDIDGLREEILREALNAPYAMHP
ncbi:UNVERIFIED_CONTAM: hypothetical protein Sindi_0963200, partial [Sesamum indicum]